MTRNVDSIPSPLEVVQLARQYPLRWLAPTIVITLLGSGVALLRNDTWEASQALIMRDEAGTPTTLDRPGKFHQPEDMKSSQETILELAKNRGVLTEALKQVGPPSNVDRKTWPRPTDIAELERNIKMTPPKGADFGKTEIFYLKVQDHGRQRACQLADAVCTQVQRRFQDLRGARAQSMIDELNRTVEVAKNDLQDSTQRITDIERKVGGDLGELRLLQESPAGDSQLRRMNLEIEAELRQVHATQQINQELLDVLKNSQADTTQLLLAPGRLLDSQPAVKRLKEGLVDAQLKAAQLQGSMSDAHPALQVAREAQNQVNDRLRNELASATASLELEIKLSADRITFLEQRLAATAQRMDRVASVRAEYGNLAAELRHRTEILKSAEQELSEARGSLAAAHSSSLLARVDQPDTGFEPIGPGKTIILAGSVAGGLALGLGWLLFSTQTAALLWAATTLAQKPTGDEVHVPAATIAPSLPASDTGNLTLKGDTVNLTFKEALKKLSGHRPAWK